MAFNNGLWATQQRLLCEKPLGDRRRLFDNIKKDFWGNTLGFGFGSTAKQGGSAWSIS